MQPKSQWTRSPAVPLWSFKRHRPLLIGRASNLTAAHDEHHR